MSLWGVESKDDCRREIDKLLAMVDRAEKRLQVNSITARPAVEELKSHLKDLYDKYNHTAEPQMSPVEHAWFWPAIQDAYVIAPNLSSPKTWAEGLEAVRTNLRYRRPPEDTHE